MNEYGDSPKTSTDQNLLRSVASQTVMCRRDKVTAKRESWNRLRDKLLGADADLLLCSAGSLSAIHRETARQAEISTIESGRPDMMIPLNLTGICTTCQARNRFAHMRDIR